MQKDLSVDYVENAIVVGSGLVLMKSDTITLEPAQVAIVYPNEAGALLRRTRV